MHLGQLWAVLPQVELLWPAGATSLEGVRVRGIECDSRRVTPGDLFVAIPGTRRNGLEFVAEAVRNGAVAVVADRGASARRVRTEAGPGVPVARVPCPREALARLAHTLHRHPSRKLDVIGITGTNGKTTTAKIVQSILARAARKPAFLGTVGYEIGRRRLPAPTTTPPSCELARLLRGAVVAGHDAVVMEVSSHALDQHRVTGMRFRAAAFTNLSRDHQDYHLDMERYFLAKRRLFVLLDPASPAVVAGGDRYAERLQDFVRRRGHPVVTCGTSDADVWAETVVPDATGSRFVLRTPRGRAEVRCELPGRCNVDNAVTAAAVAQALGVGLPAIVEGIERLPPVPGRMEQFVLPDVGAVVVVDYAHTHVALENALGALAAIVRPRGSRGRLTVVFGCGGERDPGRRPRMGRVASAIADRVVVTSDNPRGEPPDAIIADILEGVPAGADVTVEPDRRRAIRDAVARAAPGDRILIAGKGHEAFQQFKDVTIPFDDRDEVRKAIEERLGARTIAASGCREG